MRSRLNNPVGAAIAGAATFATLAIAHVLSSWGIEWALPISLAVVFTAFGAFTLRKWNRHHAPRDPVLDALQPVADFSARHLRGRLRLRLRDPDFDEAAFLARARTTWLELQRARAGQELEPIRTRVSDGLMERWSLAVAEERERGERVELEALDVESMRLVGAASDPHFDTLTVAVRTRMAGRRLGGDDGKPVEDGRFDRVREECLSFLRGRGGEGRGAARCPNCAAPVEHAAATRCASCHSVLRSDAHDWVLAEVADRVDWLPATARPVPGLAGFRRRDPGWSHQHLEDRVAVIFWRLARAEGLGRVDPLRRVAGPGFRERLARTLRPGAGAETWAERSIGEVAILALLAPEAGEEGETGDRALVEVRWVGLRLTPDAHRPGPVLKERRPLRHLLVLGRRPGARSNPALALASTRCAGCGAPEREHAGESCPFCGAAPGEDWLLLERLARHEPAAERWLERARELAAPPDDPAEAALADPDTAAALAAWAAGHLPDAEDLRGPRRALLERLAAHADEPVEGLAGCADAPEAAPADNKEAAHWLHAVADTLLAGDDEPAVREALLQGLALRGGGLDFYPARRTLRLRERRRVARGPAAQSSDA